MIQMMRIRFNRVNSYIWFNSQFAHEFKSVNGAIRSNNKRLLISIVLLWTHFSWKYTMHFVPVHSNTFKETSMPNAQIRKKISPFYCVHRENYSGAFRRGNICCGEYISKRYQFWNPMEKLNATFGRCKNKCRSIINAMDTKENSKNETSCKYFQPFQYIMKCSVHVLSLKHIWCPVKSCTWLKTAMHSTVSS